LIFLPASHSLVRMIINGIYALIQIKMLRRR